jgi:hypothetical protein
MGSISEAAAPMVASEGAGGLERKTNTAKDSLEIRKKTLLAI